MEQSVQKYLEIIESIEENEYYINSMPFCEPQLGKRGLYPTLGSQKESESFVVTMMWILNLSDGNHDVFDISVRSGIPLKKIYPVIAALLENGVLVKKMYDKQ
jgi:aminopeptidase-like protein